MGREHETLEFANYYCSFCAGMHQNELFQCQSMTYYALQFGVFLVAFVAWEYKEGKNAVLPLGILLRKTIFGACLEAVSQMWRIYTFTANATKFHSSSLVCVSCSPV